MKKANIAIVRIIYDALLRDDTQILMSLMDPEVLIEKPASLPYGGTYKGQAGAAQFLRAAAEVNKHTEFVPQSFASAGDHVFVLGHFTVWPQGTDEPYSMDAVDIWCLRDGKIVWFKSWYEDTATYLQQLPQRPVRWTAENSMMTSSAAWNPRAG